MFGQKLIYFFIAAAAFTTTSLATPDRLKVTVTPLNDAAFSVSVTFAGDADGSTRLILPNEWGGQSELFRSIRSISVQPASAKISDTDLPYVKLVTHKAGEKLTVLYEVVRDFQGKFRNEVRYRPVVDKGYIHWIGNTVFVLPDWKDEAELDVSLEWKDLPGGWTTAHSFATGKRTKRFTAALGELRASIMVAGDFRIASTRAAGKPVDVAIRGKWAFTDTELAEMVRKVIETEREFWKDHSQDRYLVTLVPIDEGPNAMSFGGTGLTDSFALFATPNATVDRLRGLLAHEYAHNWIPGKLGRMPKPEQELYWFSEGFTEFYTYRLLAAGGLITRAELVARYNELILEYYMLPVRTASNERIVKDFWSDRNVQRLPYLRGFLFATNLDAEIKRATDGKASLDDAVHELFSASKKTPQPLSFGSLEALFTKYLGRDAGPMIRQHLVDGELIVPLPDALGADVSQNTVQTPVFELGFDFDKLAKDRIVAGVDPNSSAYAAGLRNGQHRTAGFSLRFGDTATEIELKVKDQEGEKTVKFLPVARERMAVPQYSLR
ncbi:MAG: hypothetical protein AB7V18_16815 [Pyrinomonadaceae bacterium]